MAALENWSGLGFMSPHLQQGQEQRSHHSFGDKEEAGLGLRPGIWGTGCSAKEQDLVLQALSDMAQSKKRDPNKGRQDQASSLALIPGRLKIKNLSILCPHLVGEDTFGTNFSI